MIKEILEELKEADGGYGDLGTPPNPKLGVVKNRKDDEEEIEEVMPNTSRLDKKLAKKRAAALKKVHCKGDMTPHNIGVNGKFKFVCRQKDKQFAKKVSKAKKIAMKKPSGKKAIKQAMATKQFRKK